MKEQATDWEEKFAIQRTCIQITLNNKNNQLYNNKGRYILKWTKGLNKQITKINQLPVSTCKDLPICSHQENAKSNHNAMLAYTLTGMAKNKVAGC